MDRRARATIGWVKNEPRPRFVRFVAEPVLHGELFRPLRDPALFARVQLDREAHTLVWPSGADFDPTTLHDWPEHAAALAARARQWEPADNTTLR